MVIIIIVILVLWVFRYSPTAYDYWTWDTFNALFYGLHKCHTRRKIQKNETDGKSWIMIVHRLQLIQSVLFSEGHKSWPPFVYLLFPLGNIRPRLTYHSYGMAAWAVIHYFHKTVLNSSRNEPFWCCETTLPHWKVGYRCILHIDLWWKGRIV